MKRTMKTVLVVVFFAFVAAGLLAHLCLTCYPDNHYLAKVEQAFLALTEGGQDDETVVVAWDQSQGSD